MFNFLRKAIKTQDACVLPTVDMHAHFLPGIDDGAATMEDSLAMIAHLHQLGYTHLIATPHVYKEFYPNTSARIREALHSVKQAVKMLGTEIKIDAAAEYFLDDHFDALLRDNDILTLPGNYVLVEMSFVAPYTHFKQTLFEMQLKGYKPVLAHPERYPYLTKHFSELEDLVHGGCRLQVNILSLGGYYGKGPKAAAFKMLDKGMVSMLGTDAHHLQHLDLIGKIKDTREFQSLHGHIFENNRLVW